MQSGAMGRSMSWSTMLPQPSSPRPSSCPSGLLMPFWRPRFTARSLAVEWGPKGIRTVAIAPGAFPTPGSSGQLRPKGRDEWSARNPLGRAGEHRELADLASFLISDAAGYINGEMVVQDGGAHLRTSGAEDLLQWTDGQWQQQRAARAKNEREPTKG